MSDQPLVSVVIPAYNGERYLAAAIESVLAQAYRPLEVIVVRDPLSTDGNAEVLEKYGAPVRCHAQTTHGAGAARNEGVGLAQGALLGFLDADDVWVKDKLERQLAAFDADASLDMVLGHVRQFCSPELAEDGASRWGHVQEVMPGYNPGAMLIRREAFLRIGLFNPRWRMGEFMDWYARAIDHGLKSRMLDEVVFERRLHDDNMGIRERSHRIDYVHALKAMLDRRRNRPS